MRTAIVNKLRSPRVWLVLLFLVVLALPHHTRSQTSASTATTSPQSIPQRIIYHQLFNHVVYLDYQAGVADQQGLNGNALRNYYQVRAGLSAVETTLLKATAHDEITAVEAVDQQIQAEVALYRANFHNGKWPAKTPMPPLPAELHTLQVAKDNIILNHVAALQSGFGTDFQRFDTYVQSALGPHITVTTIPSPPTAPPAGTIPPAPPVPWK